MNSKTPRTDALENDHKIGFDEAQLSVEAAWRSAHHNARILERENNQLRADLRVCGFTLENNLEALRQLVSFAHSHNTISTTGRVAINSTKSALALPSVKAALKESKP